MGSMGSDIESEGNDISSLILNGTSSILSLTFFLRLLLPIDQTIVCLAEGHKFQAAPRWHVPKPLLASDWICVEGFFGSLPRK